MIRNLSPKPLNITHNLLSTTWLTRLPAMETALSHIGRQTRPTGSCHIALFEVPGDQRLHVNVTHAHETKSVKGWGGPGACLEGFVLNRMFEVRSIDRIVGEIREVVLAPLASAG